LASFPALTTPQSLYAPSPLTAAYPTQLPPTGLGAVAQPQQPIFIIANPQDLANFQQDLANFQMAQPAAATAAPKPGGAYGMDRVAVQQFTPIQEKRDISPQEAQQVAMNTSTRWWPKLYASYGTPLPELMADPTKSGIISGGLGALGGSLLGLAWSGGRPLLGAGIGAALLGIGGAITGFFARRQQNENIMDLMRRLPEGATRRDLLSDPAYQAELNRQAMSTRPTNDLASALITTSILSSAMNNLGSARSSSR
jgi:hypothetical protein